jgi:Nucleotidyl transferase of unknown function (DUF2204)
MVYAGGTAVPVSSSAEPELHPDQERLYRDVLLLLTEHRIPHAVSGAFALQEHTGVRRSAKDLDIFLTSEAACLVLELLHKHGLRCEICDPVWLAKAHRDDFFVDFITGMSNAVITVTDSWIKRARPGVVLGVTTRILAPEELLASKLFVVRRERFDGADIAHIIYASGGHLDWSRIVELAGVHWEMLLWTLVLFQYVYPAQAHYVPVMIWNRLVNRFVFKLMNPDPSASFRGSLVDENMFAIDVKEWGLDDLLSEYRACRAKYIRWPRDGMEANEGAA